MKKKISDLVIAQANQFIALDKPCGMSVLEDQSGDASLHRIAMAYCKHDLYPVHRLDRPVSGIVVFAKTKKSAAHLSEQWKTGKVAKQYLAVVAKQEGPDSGKLVHFIHEISGSNKVFASDQEEDHARQAELAYVKKAESDRYQLLEITLSTGRHHQIRAQLAAEGMPVKGDVKYGFRRGNKDRSIHLHAWKLAFEHPTSGKMINLKADPPADVVWDAFKTYWNA